MTNFTKNAANFTARQGLYRVWVPLHNDGKTPLICIWIDPTMGAFESRQNHKDAPLSGVSDDAHAGEIEGSWRCAA
jgi:hypothetical protein